MDVRVISGRRVEVIDCFVLLLARLLGSIAIINQGVVFRLLGPTYEHGRLYELLGAEALGHGFEEGLSSGRCSEEMGAAGIGRPAQQIHASLGLRQSADIAAVVDLITSFD